MPKKSKPQPKPHPPSSSTTSSSLSWPPLPQLPITDLTPIPVPLPSSPTPKIFLIKTFFPRSLARTYLSYLRILPLTTTPPPASRKERAEMAARVNDRFQVHDSLFAHALWTRTGLREVVEGMDGEIWNGEVVGLSPNIRIYRYTPGQFFDCHYDESTSILAPSPTDPTVPIPAQTTWTLLLYLTSAADGCIGGETVFYPNDAKIASEAVAIAPETGMLLLHKHGDDCLLHEGKLVTAGEKWIIRTDLCVKR